MKYFEIKPDTNPKKIGHYPQSELGKEPSYGVHSLKHDRLPDISPELKLKLFKSTIVTDYLDNFVISYGMVISNRFKSVLGKFILPTHDFYRVEVNSTKEKYIYNWLHFISTDFMEHIDLEKSKAIILNSKKEQKVIDLKTGEDKLRKMLSSNLTNNRKAKWDKIVFKNSFPKYDLFKTQMIEYETIISERLLNALKEANITGFVTKPYIDIEFQ